MVSVPQYPHQRPCPGHAAVDIPVVSGQLLLMGDLAAFIGTLWCSGLCIALVGRPQRSTGGTQRGGSWQAGAPERDRSEEHTSELQSRENLVCRLLLEKKK